MVANPGRSQLKGDFVILFFLSPFAPENLVSQDRSGGVPSRVSRLILHTQV